MVSSPCSNTQREEIDEEGDEDGVKDQGLRKQGVSHFPQLLPAFPSGEGDTWAGLRQKGGHMSSQHCHLTNPEKGQEKAKSRKKKE